jgi:aminomethyltransferase
VNRTALYKVHVALGARMVDFAGWEMPVQYTGPLEEHHTVRTAAGLFDIDHMGQVTVEGPDGLAFLQSVVTSDMSGLNEGEAGYGLLCYADGGAVDDLFVYRLPDRYFIAVNAGNRKKDVRWMQAHAWGYDVTVTDISDETYMLALQGPQAGAILQALTPADLSRLAFHYATESEVAGVKTLIGRTGYTGEDGFELFFDANQAGHVWDALLEAGQPHGLQPIGLAARDSLRFEPCLPLYGDELGPDISPLEAGLGWAVSFDKGPFIGREALLKQRLEGPPRKLVAFEMEERGVPRHGYTLRVDGETGVVTSGMYAPTVERYVGLALIPAAYAEVGQPLEVDIHGRARAARVVEKPFYTPAYRR